MKLFAFARTVLFAFEILTAGGKKRLAVRSDCQ